MLLYVGNQRFEDGVKRIDPIQVFAVSDRGVSNYTSRAERTACIDLSLYSLMTRLP